MKPVSWTISHFDDIFTITLRMVIFTHQDAASLPRQLLPEAKNFYLLFTDLRNLLIQRSCLRGWTNSKNICPRAPRNTDGSSDAHFFCRQPFQLNSFLHITVSVDSSSSVWLSLIIFLVWAPLSFGYNFQSAPHFLSLMWFLSRGILLGWKGKKSFFLRLCRYLWVTGIT